MKKYRVLIISLIAWVGLASFGAGIVTAWTDRTPIFTHHSVKTMQIPAETITPAPTSAISTASREVTTPSTSTMTTSNQSGIYAALGDSVAAGLGLPIASSATDQDKQCGRSVEAYPVAVAKAQGLSLVHAACSGATAGDLFTSQGVSGPNIPPQLNAAFAQGTPKLITITAGANDVHWVGFLRKCYAVTCGSGIDQAALKTYRAILEAKLIILFNDILVRSRGAPPAIVVTGYYNPLSAGCTAIQQQITPSELSWINSELATLNQTLQNMSSNFSNVTFAPVSFAGHDICSANPWVQGATDAAPFHPTKQGQEAIAAAVLEML